MKDVHNCSPWGLKCIKTCWLSVFSSLQLPEPILPFQLYNSLMGLAKESLQAEGSEGGEAGKGPELKDLGPNTEPEVLKLVEKVKELLSDIPKANHSTLRYIVRHLHRWVPFTFTQHFNQFSLTCTFNILNSSFSSIQFI